MITTLWLLMMFLVAILMAGAFYAGRIYERERGERPTPPPPRYPWQAEREDR